MNFVLIFLITIFSLSLYLIPNLLTVVLPFIVIMGLCITFVKLFRDKEIISMSENVKAKGFATLKDLEKISYWKSPRSHHHIQKNINKTIYEINFINIGYFISYAFF